MGEAPGDRHLRTGVGRHKSRALIGFHHFTGDDNDPIVETISRLVEGLQERPECKISETNKLRGE